MKIGINFCCVLAILSADALSLNANVTVPDSVAEPGVEQMDTLFCARFGSGAGC